MRGRRKSVMRHCGRVFGCMLHLGGSSARACHVTNFNKERVCQTHTRVSTSPHKIDVATIMMNRTAVALQRLMLGRRVPHRAILQPRLFSAATCEQVSDDIPDYFDTLGLEVRLGAPRSCCLVSTLVPSTAHTFLLLHHSVLMI